MDPAASCDRVLLMPGLKAGPEVSRQWQCDAQTGFQVKGLRQECGMGVELADHVSGAALGSVQAGSVGGKDPMSYQLGAPCGTGSRAGRPGGNSALRGQDFKSQDSDKSAARA